MSSGDQTYVCPNQWATLLCIGGLGFFLPVILFRPDILASSDVTGTALNYLSCHANSLVITFYAGIFGDVIYSLSTDYRIWVRNYYCLCILVHLFEGVVAVLLCAGLDYGLADTAKWFASVLVHGMFSLTTLIKRFYRHETETRSKINYADFLQ